MILPCTSINNNLIVACDLVMFLIKSKAENCVEIINCINSSMTTLPLFGQNSFLSGIM